MKQRIGTNFLFVQIFYMCMRVTETFIIKYMSPIWSTRLEQRLGSVHLYWLFALPQAVRSLDIERM